MRTFERSAFEKLVIIDPKKAFNDAIRDWLNNPENYMYMYSDSKYNYFKHSLTREYRSFKYYPLTNKKF